LQEVKESSAISVMINPTGADVSTDAEVEASQSLQWNTRVDGGQDLFLSSTAPASQN
jgi:hypothetical protein